MPECYNLAIDFVNLSSVCRYHENVNWTFSSLAMSYSLCCKLDRSLASARNEGWAGNRVAVDLRVGVERNTRVVGRVELLAERASGLCGAGASNLEVDTLRVVLGTVGLLSGVQSDDLVSHDIVAGGNGAWNYDGPVIALRDELVRGPFGWVARRADAGLVNLEEFQGGLVDSGAGPAAVSEVGDDRPDVRPI